MPSTPFSVPPNDFAQGGNDVWSTAYYYTGSQQVDLAAYGSCGWINPGPSMDAPVNTAGRFQLRLVYGVSDN